jgi:hypothetical protein
MRYGNFLQVLAIIVLVVLTAYEYRTSCENTETKLYQLKVDRSYSGRYDLTPVYGSNVKGEIDTRIAYHKERVQLHWDHMQYKLLVIMALALVSIFHFIRYFYVPYDLEHEHLPMAKYDAFTWFLNFLFFAFVSIWYAYFSNGEEGALIGYVLGLLCATKCLWHLSEVIQTQGIKKLTGIRVAEIGIATLIYFHLIGFVVCYYMLMMMGLPAIINILRGL